MPRFYLNKLINKIEKSESPDQTGRQGRQLTPPEPPGLWKDDAGAEDFLKNLVHDIDVGGHVPDSRLAHSVPSVYARPIVFANALGDRDNPLHDAVVQEWRGLMSVFALKSWIKYSLDIREYPISAPPKGKTSQVGRMPYLDLHLRTMLNSLLPEPPEFWNPLRLIYLNNTLIGGASPWTLGFTSAGKIAEHVVPWARNGVLKDPIEIYKGRGAPFLELTFIARWIDRVLDAKEDEQHGNWGMQEENGDGDYISKITTELKTWKKALKDGHYIDET